MTEKALPNPLALRYCVLSEFLEGKPISQTFEKLCETLGSDSVNYPEFEFWWMRYAKGNFDMNYDRSQDTPTFTDLPVNVHEKIFNHLGLKKSFLLRKVCKSFRALVDTWNPNFESMDIYSCPGIVSLDFGDENMIFMKNTDSKTTVTINKMKHDRDGNYQDLAVDVIYSILKHPKLELKTVSLNGKRVEPRLALKLSRKFESLKHKIRAEKVRLLYGPYLLLLQYFQPGNLKNIIMWGREEEVSGITSEDIKDTVLSMNQMKQCQKADILLDCDIMKMDTEFLIVKMLESPIYTVQYEKLSVEDSVKILKILLQSSKNYHKVTIILKSPLNTSEISRKMVEIGATCYADLGPSATFWHYESPNSKYDAFYKIILQENIITIENRMYQVKYDESQDPKYRTFFDLPFHVLQKVLKNSDEKMRFSLRNVCKSFRALVDTWDPDYKKMEIKSWPGKVLLVLDGLSITYTRVSEKLLTVSYDYNDDKYKYDQIGQYQNVAVDDVVSLLKHPNLKLEEFWFCGERIEVNFAWKLYQKLGLFYHKIQSTLVVLPPGNSLQMLRFFEPKIMKSFGLRMDRGSTEISTALLEKSIQIMNGLEQCQQAQMVHFEPKLRVLDTESILVRKTKLPKITMVFEELKVDEAMETLKMMFQNFERIRIWGLLSISSAIDISSLKDELVKFGATEDRSDDSSATTTLYYQPPDTEIDNTLVIWIYDRAVSIVPKKCCDIALL